MTDTELEAMLENPAIIRNRAKIFATRANAQAFLQLQAEYGSFDAYLWSFVEGKTVVNDVPDYRQAPAKTPLSEKLAKDLKKRDFKFTGPVAVLSFLQAAGLVDDHENDCEWKGLK
ncbi:DNA-3-methyladenine glycosylase I [Streptococcus pneumoniae]|nr:DNA-3-methyladenine glycosylase I [Streptococcus pneumoniae]